MNNMKVRSGGRLSFNITRGDSTAVSATFIMQHQDTDIFISVTEAYNSEGIAAFELGSPETDVVGVYDYQVNENYATGSPDIYPDISGCDDDCELPTVTVCESLQEES
jgi:hypothetical protein